MKLNHDNTTNNEISVQRNETMKGKVGSHLTYSDTTSLGKVCGTDVMSSHSALSFVQVHPTGHRGCLSLLPSVRARAATHTHRHTVHARQLTVPPEYPIYLFCLPRLKLDYFTLKDQSFLGIYKNPRESRKIVQFRRVSPGPWSCIYALV